MAYGFNGDKSKAEIRVIERYVNIDDITKIEAGYYKNYIRKISGVDDVKVLGVLGSRVVFGGSYNNRVVISEVYTKYDNAGNCNICFVLVNPHDSVNIYISDGLTFHFSLLVI